MSSENVLGCVHIYFRIHVNNLPQVEHICLPTSKSYILSRNQNLASHTQLQTAEARPCSQRHVNLLMVKIHRKQTDMSSNPHFSPSTWSPKCQHLSSLSSLFYICNPDIKCKCELQMFVNVFDLTKILIDNHEK